MVEGIEVKLQDLIRDIPDFPTKGIIFKDITPLLRDGPAFKEVIKQLAARYKDESIDVVLGAEARGFILAGALAYSLGCGFVPARKPGKLPHETTSAEYELEYGTDILEMHLDAITPGQRVLVVDDVLATGGTASAKVDLVEKVGGEVVGIAFLIELGFLNGRDRLPGREVFSLIKY